MTSKLFITALNFNTNMNMKKILTLLTMTAITFIANASTYYDFKIGD